MSRQKHKTRKADKAFEVVRFAALSYAGEMCQEVANMIYDRVQPEIHPEREKITEPKKALLDALIKEKLDYIGKIHEGLGNIKICAKETGNEY